MELHTKLVKKRQKRVKTKKKQTNKRLSWVHCATNTVCFLFPALERNKFFLILIKAGGNLFARNPLHFLDKKKKTRLDTSLVFLRFYGPKPHFGP